MAQGNWACFWVSFLADMLHSQKRGLPALQVHAEARRSARLLSAGCCAHDVQEVSGI